MNLALREERIGDEEAIDAVNSLAFESMDEANIVRLLRAHHPGFDRRYSLTAWDGEAMVGHALFTPARVRYLGDTVPALSLGPIAVMPERQKEGIGGALLEHGHALGKREGFAFVFLNGHPSYYPRYGYKACFGFSRVTLECDAMPEPRLRFRRLPVRPADVPWLAKQHRTEWEDVDFAWLWGTAPGEWSFPPMNAVLWWTEDGRRAAYTVDTPGKGKAKLLLAEDPALALDVLAILRPPTLDHHPSGWLARNVLMPAWSKVKAKAHPAAMAYPLQEGILDRCLEAQKKGRPPGFCLFPLPFLAC